ncbi:MAG: polymer-forming cytoskeletal protein, partial [Elusimicrobia bacterium]|nr:polymer-forming cytoskeletal protein [Elusimicrobiota bacterium]
MTLLKKGAGASSGREGLTIISEEASFHGVLAVKGSLRVDGAVEGDISDAVAVSVGKAGRVKGNIAAETLSVAGEIDGNVIASSSIEILAGGRLRGDIRTANLKIEEGALFDGNCAMGDTGSGRAAERKARDLPLPET